MSFEINIRRHWLVAVWQLGLILVLAACGARSTVGPEDVSPTAEQPETAPTEELVPTEHIDPGGVMTLVAPTQSENLATEQPEATQLTITVEPIVTPTPEPIRLIDMPLMGIESHNLIAESNQNLLAQTNTQIVRKNGVFWPHVEPQEGARNWFVLRDLEKELAFIAEQGMETILIVRGTPGWAQEIPGSICGPVLPEKLQAFADFVADLVARYSVAPYNVKYWEIGNEPDVFNKLTGNNALFFGCWGDEEDPYYGGGYYAELLKAVYPVIKEINPDAQVLVGGLLLDCDPTYPPAGKDCKSANFLEGILQNGGAPYFDIVSFHGYPNYVARPDISPLYSDDHFPSWKERGGVVIGKVNFIREVLSTYGVEKPLFLTESSLSCPGWFTIECLSNDFYQSQAEYVVRLFVKNWANEIDATIWYQFEDKGWRYTGMVGPNPGKPNPAYQVYKYLTQKLDSAIYVGPVATCVECVAHTFVNGDHRTWVIWSLNRAGDSYELPPGVIGVYDMYGNELAVENNTVVFNRPIYIDLAP